MPLFHVLVCAGAAACNHASTRTYSLIPTATGALGGVGFGGIIASWQRLTAFILPALNGLSIPVSLSAEEGRGYA